MIYIEWYLQGRKCLVFTQRENLGKGIVAAIGQTDGLITSNVLKICKNVEIGIIVNQNIQCTNYGVTISQCADLWFCSLSEISQVRNKEQQFSSDPHHRG